MDLFAELYAWSCQLFRIKLAVIGSTVTMLDNESSSIDIFVNLTEHDENISLKDVVLKLAEVTGVGNVIKDDLGENEMIEIYDEQGQISICFCSDSRFLNRTAYIIAALNTNKWLIPATKILLKWGRNVIITGSTRNKNRILSAENLALVFISITLEKNSRFFSVVLKEKIERNLELLRENHFQICNITNCLHIDKNTNDEQVILADIVMNFFRNFSSSREEAMKELESIPDPCTTSSSRKLLKFNNPKHLAQLVE